MSGKGRQEEAAAENWTSIRCVIILAALLLNHGAVYLVWASACDVGPIPRLGYGLRRPEPEVETVFNAFPDADDSGICEGGTGPAADKAVDIFLATGNGRFDAGKGGRDCGDSLLKVDGASLRPSDYFAPVAPPPISPLG